MDFSSAKKRRLSDGVDSEEGGFSVDKERVKKLLGPFSRDQLVEILISAGSHNEAIFNEIKAIASADPAHRKIFVRGLAWETTTERLLDAFSEFGEIEEGAVIIDKVTQKSRGFGFITFKDMDGAYNALECTTKNIDGRETVCNLAACRDSQASTTPQFATPAPSNPGDVNSRKIFVRGLPWDTTTDTLLSVFAQYGEIEEGIIATDRETGRSKGFGFITFKDIHAANRALATPQKAIDGRTTYCNLAAAGNPNRHDRNSAPSPMNNISNVLNGPMHTVSPIAGYVMPQPQSLSVYPTGMGAYNAQPQPAAYGGYTQHTNYTSGPYTAPPIQQTATAAAAAAAGGGVGGGYSQRRAGGPTNYTKNVPAHGHYT